MIDFTANYSMTVDGAPLASASHIDVIDPATGLVFTQAPAATQADVDRAVQAAARAFPAWAATAVADRQAALVAIAKALEDHIDDFMRLLTREQGKPHALARAEIDRCVFWLREYAAREMPVLRFADASGRKFETRHVPLGVVAAIVPWNFPMTLAIWKIAPALLAGNTMVLKPSPFTPLCALKLGELVRDLLSPGVFNVLSGADELGPWLTQHPGIAKIAFTGSTQTGKHIMRAAAQTLKRVTLELGGNDPAIILPDVDVEKVAPDVFWAAFRNTSQFCVAAKRIYVHEQIYDRFAAALRDYAATVQVGPGDRQGVGMGPLQNAKQYERIKTMIADARAQGLSFLTGGDVPQQQGGGYFLPPTIVDRPPDDAAVVTEEAFGPIVPLLSWRDEDDVVARANASEYGLAASVWSRDEKAARRIADRLESGTVWINTVHHLSPNVPFSGHKESGLGAENGEAGLLAYTNTKTVVI